jgi:pyrroline-5-carboxylate reductase
MDEPTHIIRNGVRVDLTEQEKAEYRALWAQGEAKMQAERQKEIERSEQRKKILSRLGLTEDELALLKVL